MMLDLSNLSAEEREIIEQVFKRQRDEEEKETQMSQKASEELEELDKTLNERKELSKKLIGTQDDAICQICQKTKFADGIGHKCFYCQLRSCARCGGRAQSKGKAIWACSLCQKRQQILAKTGKWFQPDEPVQKTSVSGTPSQAPSPQPSQSDLQEQPVGPMQPNHQQNNNFGPPLQQPGLQHPPQQNHTAQPRDNRVMGPPNGGGPMVDHHAPGGSQMNQRPQPQGNNDVRQKRIQEDRRQNTLHRQPSLEADQYKKQQGNGSVAHHKTSYDGQQRQQQHQHPQQQHPQQLQQQHHQHQQHQQQQHHLQQHPQQQQQNQQQQQQQQQQRFENQRMESFDRQRGPTERKTSVTQRPVFFAGDESGSNPRMNQRREDGPSQSVERVTEENYSSSSHFNSTGRDGRNTNEKRKSTVRAVPSDPPRTKNRLHRQLRSMSSSEEEAEAGPSRVLHPDESVQRLTEECTSEKDLLRYIYGNDVTKSKAKNGGRELSTSPNRGIMSPSRHPPPSNNSTVIPGDVLAAKIKTYLSHPVTWQPSADQKRLIGHMILHKTDNTPNGDLGLKVVGGRRSDTGRLGAFITQVKPGGVADTVGRLRAGDEVLEWNGQPLQNATYEQVYETIAASKHDTQVDLIVSRSATLPGGDDFLNVHTHTSTRQLPNPQFVMAQDPYYSRNASPLLTQLSHSQSAMLVHPVHQMSPQHRASVNSFYPDMAPPVPDHQTFGKGHIFGRIEISIMYLHAERQLSIALERAMDLPPRPDGTPRNPYVKLFLLPDRSEKSRRQSAVLAETLLPVWSEVFYYNGLTEPLVLQRVLEVTVWDYDKFGTNSFLGETLIDLSCVPFDGRTLLYTLVDMDEDNPLRTRLRMRKSSYYSQYPHRPHSEMNFSYQPTHPKDYYHDYYDDSEQMRRSTTYDKGIPRRARIPEQEDWNINQTSGYLSDHGYAQVNVPPHMPRYRQRRPRSATAMRHMVREEMGASRAYTKALPSDTYEEEEPLERRQYPLRPSRDHLLRGTNGIQLNEPQGYGSDGSETMSVHSCNSMPIVTTINRRQARPPIEETTSQEASVEEYDERRPRPVREDSTPKQSSAGLNNMKERKKSLMTRFIPGRGAGAEAKRTGFARSEEVGIPENLSTDRLQPPFLKQASRESTDSAHSDNWMPVLSDGPLGTFVDNLGPGQVVGRQVLASPVLGEIQIGIMTGRSGIDVEVIRAKNLVVKPGVKVCPAPYVKVYLMEGKQCIAKAKTNPVKKTTSPLFQQHLIFNDSPKKKMLQITVLGDYGRMERKVFMGIAQIRLDDLELGPQPLIGWYKLFHSSSLAGTGPVRKDSEVSLSNQP